MTKLWRDGAIVAAAFISTLSLGCSKTLPCAPGTVFVAFELGELQARAATIELDAWFDRRHMTYVQPEAPRTLRSLETLTMDLNMARSLHPAVVLTAIVRSSQGRVLAQETLEGNVTGSCLAMRFSFDVNDAGLTDAGTGGSGAGGAATGGAATGGAATGGAATGGAATGGAATGGVGVGGGATGGLAAGGAASGGTGTGGAPPTCTDQCVLGTSQCAGGAIQKCELASNGCTAPTTTSCGAAPLWCERYAGPVCADVTWTQWPLPPIPSTGQFKDNQDGTITDNVTWLIWQKTPATDTFTWDQAINHCRGLRLAGHTDWRLPSQNELLSIVDYGRRKPAIDTGVFAIAAEDAPIPTVFWSSTERARVMNGSWYVWFREGLTIVDRDQKEDDAFSASLKTNQYYARCVR